MSCPLRQRLRSAARVALLAAFVHQLGACPCGCLDHNAWYQSVVATVANAAPQPMGPGVPIADEAHCDGDLGVDCLTASRPAIDGPLGYLPGAVAPVPTAAVGALVFASAVAANPSRPALGAPRARSTVWRL